MTAPGPCHKCGNWISETEPCAWIDPPEWLVQSPWTTDAKSRPVCIACTGGFADKEESPPIGIIRADVLSE